MRRILMFLFGLFASVAIHAQVRYDVQGNCPDGIGRHVYLQLLVGSLDRCAIMRNGILRYGGIQGNIFRRGASEALHRDCQIEKWEGFHGL